jgi:hypothetical protein
MSNIYKDGFIFRRSKRKNKKYDVFNARDNLYITSFGDDRYPQFKDKIGVFSSTDHGDKQRRDNYYSRHGKSARKWSAKWFSHKFLW